MKDPRDRSTVELLETPRRGRPRKDSAKSGAQRQKEYRERQKQLGLPTLQQALAGFEVWHLPKGCRKWRKWSGVDALSWQAALSVLNGAVQANRVIANDLPELVARYEIRPARILPGLPDSLPGMDSHHFPPKTDIYHD